MSETPLRERYDYYIKAFDALVGELRLPFLDCKLFRKYFIEEQTEENLYKLYTLVSILQTHKSHTVNLLRLIFEREQVFNAIKIVEKEFTSKNTPAIEVQTKSLQLLHALQQATLKITEAIRDWRAHLARPYPFNWNGVNYLFKIMKDCQYLDSCKLKEVLPFQMELYPLCSNLTTLQLFKPKRKESADTGASISIQFPLKVIKNAGEATVEQDSELQLRLRRGEASIFAEREIQANLTKELKDFQAKDTFVTILDVRAVIPNCVDGIHLTNKEWANRLGEALNDTARKLDFKDPSSG